MAILKVSDIDTHPLFTPALGLSSPWRVIRTSFTIDEKRHDLHVDFAAAAASSVQNVRRRIVRSTTPRIRNGDIWISFFRREPRQGDQGLHHLEPSERLARACGDKRAVLRQATISVDGLANHEMLAVQAAEGAAEFGHDRPEMAGKARGSWPLGKHQSASKAVRRMQRYRSPLASMGGEEAIECQPAANCPLMNATRIREATTSTHEEDTVTQLAKKSGMRGYCASRLTAVRGAERWTA